MLTFQEFMESENIDEAIKTPYAYKFLDKEGKMVFAMPFSFKDIEEFVKHAKDDIKQWIKATLKSDQYVADKDKKTFIKSDELFPLFV